MFRPIFKKVTRTIYTSHTNQPFDMFKFAKQMLQISAVGVVIGFIGGSIYGGVEEFNRIENVIDKTKKELTDLQKEFNTENHYFRQYKIEEKIQNISNKKLDQNIYTEILNNGLKYSLLGLFIPILLLTCPIIIPLYVIKTNNEFRYKTIVGKTIAENTIK